MCVGRQLKPQLGSCEVSGAPQAPALEGRALHFCCYWLFGQFYSPCSLTLLCGFCIVSLPDDASSMTMSVVCLSAIFHQILPYCQFCDEVNFGQECLSRVRSAFVRNGGNVGCVLPPCRMYNLCRIGHPGFIHLSWAWYTGYERPGYISLSLRPTPTTLCATFRPIKMHTTNEMLLQSLLALLGALYITMRHHSVWNSTQHHSVTTV